MKKNHPGLPVRQKLSSSAGEFLIFHLPKLKTAGFGDPSKLPYSIKIILESAVRNCDGYQITEEDVRKLSDWSPKTAGQT